MRRGVPLTDSDRMPWLETLRDTLIDYILRGQCVVLACSALLPKYRDLLRTADYDFLPEASTCEAVNKSNEDWTVRSNDTDSHKQAREGRSLNSHVVFVYLKCTAELLVPRVIAREVAGTHYMPASLLQSQIDSLKLEKSEGDILEIDASLSPPVIVQRIRTQLAV